MFDAFFVAMALTGGDLGANQRNDRFHLALVPDLRAAQASDVAATTTMNLVERKLTPYPLAEGFFRSVKLGKREQNDVHLCSSTRWTIDRTACVDRNICWR
jgi:hypothetical protein